MIDELSKLKNKNAREAIAEAMCQGWLIETALPYYLPTPEAFRHLDAGERDALKLAQVCKADLVLIDESEGRKAAASLGIKLTGVVGILIAARLKGSLPSLKSELLRLKTDARFFIAPALERKALQLARELPESTN